MYTCGTFNRNGRLTQERNHCMVGQPAYLRGLSVGETSRVLLRSELERVLRERDTPELDDFVKAVVLEAQHQRARWGTEHDTGKGPADWFWLIGYLAGKALYSASSGDLDKAKHHTISTAAALANWHASLSGVSTSMRPGIEPPEKEP